MNSPKILPIGAIALATMLPLASANAATVEVLPTTELGFVKALQHDIQIGEGTHRLDYVNEGGQEILLPFYRFEIALALRDRHEIGFLYQPLTLQTKTRVDLSGGMAIDDVVFADDTPLDLQYGFDFYRLTYRYRFASPGCWRFSAGGALQIRNASIIFDGYDDEGNEIRVVSQDLGPVPVISLAARREIGDAAFFESTLDGFFAPVRYLNLRDVDVVGWLYDFALRVGVPIGEIGEAYISTRFLGGGADGTGRERSFWTQSRDEPRYTWNNLNLVAVSLGARLMF